jgi:hypothetical protein
MLHSYFEHFEQLHVVTHNVRTNEFETNLNIKQIKIMSTEVSKTNKIIAWVISGLLTALFLFSASGKFMHPEQMVQMKLADWRIIIAIGEIVSALLFLVPKTNKFGTILLSSYLGGAIILHMTGGMSIVMPSVILILVWITAVLRNPELLKLK